MTLDPSTFVEKLTEDLIGSAPEDVQVMVVGSEPLRNQLMELQRDVREGLEAVLRGGLIEALERRLRDRKTDIVAAAPDHNFTIERLVARAIEDTLKAARLAREEASRG